MRDIFAIAVAACILGVFVVGPLIPARWLDRNAFWAGILCAILAGGAVLWNG